LTELLPSLTELSSRVLYHCVQFAREFPILTGRSQFSWAHYRALLQVENKAQRQQIGAQAARNGWTSVELEDRLKKHLEPRNRRNDTKKNLFLAPH
jgi:hypothetical protein